MHSPVKTEVSMASAGFSPWVPIDTNQRPFEATLDVSLDSGSSGTLQPQYTSDNPNDFKDRKGGLAITRSGTTATVFCANPHGLSAGDSIVVIGSGDANLDGTYPVATAAPNTLTYTVANMGAVAGTGNEKVAFLRVYPVPNMGAMTARGDGVLKMPVRAVRLAVTVAGAGIGRLAISQGYGRG